MARSTTSVTSTIDRLSRPIVDVQRDLRGRVYQASRLVRRLEAAVRNVEQQVALDQARELLDALRRRAAVEGIAPEHEVDSLPTTDTLTLLIDRQTRSTTNTKGIGHEMTQDTTASPFVDQTSMDTFRASLRCGQYVHSQGRSGTCGKPAVSVKPRRDNLPEPLCKLHTTLTRKDEARWSYRNDFVVRDITDDDLIALKIAHDEHVAREAVERAARQADAAARTVAAKARTQQETLATYDVLRADKHEPDWDALRRNERATIDVPRWYVATSDTIASADMASDYPINSWGAIEIESKPEYGEPRLHVRNASTLTPNEARALARALNEAADAID